MKSPVNYLQKNVEMRKANFCVWIFAALSLFFNVLAYGEVSDKDILSANERQWLAKNQSRLVLAVETGYAPFVFIDKKDRPTGLAQDYIRLIESKIGVRFNQRRFPNLNEIFQAMHNGDVQIVNAVTNTAERSKFLAITNPFISVPNVIIVRKDHSGPMAEHHLQGLRVSLVKSYAITEHMANRGLHFIPDLVSDDLSALLNVSFGRSDAAVIDLATASYLISEKGISNLSVAGEVTYDIRLAIGTPLNETVLHGIIQKGLNAITEAERLEIKNRWISASKIQSIFKDRQFWLVLGSILAIVFVVLAVILVWNRMLRQQVELRKKAEHALKVSEEILNEAQHISRVGSWELNLANGKLAWSDEIFHLFEIDKQLFAATYEAFLNVIHPDDRDPVNQAYTRSLETRQSYEITHRLLMSDGRVKWVAERCHSYFDSQGKPIRSVGTVQDITERMLSEEKELAARRHAEEQANALAKSERFVKAIADHLPGMVGYWDKNLHCRFANQPYLEWFGKTPEQMIGISMQELMGEKLFALNEPHIRKALAGEKVHFERTLTKANGSIGYTWANYIPDIDAQGIVLGFFVMVADVTPLKEVEEEKNELQRNQQALLNAIQESVFLLERDGTVRIANDVATRRLGVKPEELIGHNVFNIFPPKVAEKRKRDFERIAETGKPETIEDERAGYSFLSSNYPIFNDKGEVVRFAVYAADVTQQRKQQAIEEMLSMINQEILQGFSLHEVLATICQKVAELFQFQLVWMGRKEAGGGVEVLAAAGAASHYVEQLKVIGVRWDNTPQGRGPTGSAIRFGQAQISKADDVGFKAWAQIALENNLLSIFAIPLVIRGEIYGAFTLYSSNSAFFESSELTNQLNNIGKRICVALEVTMDQQQVRLLSSALEAAGNGIVITDAQGRIQWVNPAFMKLSGYSMQELLGQTPRILNSGKQSKEYYEAMWNTINKGDGWSSETVERSKDGSLYTVSQTITPIISEDKITHFIAIHEDISLQKQTQERVSHMAHFDALTGLPNRTLFFDRLRQALSLAKRNEGGLSVLYMDLDGFKQVNDNLGHHAGDILLTAVADRLSRCIRESDTVARMGGDEFTVVLTETHKLEDVAMVAQKIINAIAVPFDLEGSEAHIGISIGIACYADEVDNEDELMKRADQAMYEAKMSGKNTYRIVSDT